MLVALVGLLAALLAAPSGNAAPTTLARTEWQMFRTPAVIPIAPGINQHGAVALYDYAPPVPGLGDAGWGPAPNGATIGFGNSQFSRIDEAGYGCFQAVDFTFFQTLVSIPANFVVNQFTVDFQGMDDGSRITLYNSTYPDGLVVPGSYVFLGGSGTANLAAYVAVGEVNRVVVTQVDDCPVGNTLQSAVVTANGFPIAPTAPTVRAGQSSVTVDEGTTATNSGTFDDPDDEPVALSASVGTVTPDPGTGTWNWSLDTSDGPAESQTVVVTATDTSGSESETTFELVVNNVDPTADAGTDQTVQAGDTVTVSGSWTDPAASADDLYSWSWDLDGDGVADESGTAAYGSPVERTTSFAAIGTNVLTFEVTDKDGGTSSDTVTIEVVNQPPDCSVAEASGDLWPPNHKMVDVTVEGVTDPDGDSVAITITSIFQDEEVDAKGSGKTPRPDATGVGTSTASVRAERSGTGDGRVYHIGFTADDGRGGSCSGTVTTGVPHDQAKPIVDGGPLFDSTVG